MKIALVLPPLTQLNAPYPATAYLARALRERGIACTQRDLGIELVLSLFSREGLAAVFDAVAEREELPEPAWRALALRRQHEDVVEPVIRFLQGKDRTLATRILDTPFLPRGPRLAAADLEGFGPLAADDTARRLATLYVEDLADLVTSCVDDGFSLARYHHHLAVGPTTFQPLADRLARTTLVDARLDALADSIDADVVGLSVPFPGNVYGALRIGRRLRARGAYVVMGGGYVNTELRDVGEPRLWDHVDALTYDDGEGPLLAILARLAGEPDRRHRTRTREGRHDHPAEDVPAAIGAWYGDLRLDRYLQLVDSLNPAHRLWSDGRWNKITLAHGCYWRKCSFCDVQLDYIAGYRPARAGALADVMAELVADTGQSGFHFVDEAAPPAGMRALALELLARRLPVTWWGNVRFEKAFTPDLCRLLAAAGLVAVTGGLEVASDRLLARMEKGVTVDQVARAAAAFKSAGVLVHAYLMYGFPTETEQETVDSLELVRQLFAEGLLDSAFWHRFVLTRHSAIHPDPGAFGVIVPPLPPGVFAANDVPHVDPTGADPDRFDEALPRALAAWMRGRELDRPAHAWIPGAPPTSEPPDRIRRALAPPADAGDRLVWLGGDVLADDDALVLCTPERDVRVRGRRAEIEWLAEVVEAARPDRPPLRFDDARRAFPGEAEACERKLRIARAAGLVRV
ncbi:MAG: B12-binding domain-containing radical SAM protein [Myxococcota bacterium]